MTAALIPARPPPECPGGPGRRAYSTITDPCDSRSRRNARADQAAELGAGQILTFENLHPWPLCQAAKVDSLAELAGRRSGTAGPDLTDVDSAQGYPTAILTPSPWDQRSLGRDQADRKEDGNSTRGSHTVNTTHREHDTHARPRRARC